MALYLKRRPGESITLRTPDGIEIVVTYEVDGIPNARIGIEAPREVKVVRSELPPRD